VSFYRAGFTVSLCDQLKTKMFTCNQCQQTFATKYQRTAHIREMHQVSIAVNVQYADKTLPVTISRENVQSKWSCPLGDCNYSSDSVQVISRHVRMPNLHLNQKEALLNAVETGNFKYYLLFTIKELEPLSKILFSRLLMLMTRVTATPQVSDQ
jgi:hypothetical protein